ncbi:class I SAM-dependent methyltransferase [Nocardia sp. NPDC004278]
MSGSCPRTPAPRSARCKDAPPGITWLRGDATDVPETGADLAVMSGNVAQVFVTDDEWSDALNAIGRALRPGGHVVFETRRPERRAWEDWARHTGPVVRDVLGIGRVEQRLDVTAVQLPLVSFRHTYTFATDYAVVVSDSTLRFRHRAEPRRPGRARSSRTRVRVHRREDVLNQLRGPTLFGYLRLV